jgi:hypothetical protein
MVIPAIIIKIVVFFIDPEFLVAEKIMEIHKLRLKNLPGTYGAFPLVTITTGVGRGFLVAAFS